MRHTKFPTLRMYVVRMYVRVYVHMGVCTYIRMYVPFKLFLINKTEEIVVILS